MEKVKVSQVDPVEEDYKRAVSSGCYHGSLDEFREWRKKYCWGIIGWGHPDPPGELGEEGTIGNNSGTISGWILENRKLGEPLL